MDKRVDDIKAIREMMEKSTKFLSLSGLSGIIAGTAALLGAAFAYFYLLRDPGMTDYNRMQELYILLAIAVAVLMIALTGGIYLSWKKARKHNEQLFNKAAKLTVYNMAVPLVSGGIFCLIFLLRGNVAVPIAGSLLFYGLALINASKYTLEEVHSLGLAEIVLGLAAALFARWGILFWALGFGVCHIAYGVIMYMKYDRAKEN